jgi:hypothetical protein
MERTHEVRSSREDCAGVHEPRRAGAVDAPTRGAGPATGSLRITLPRRSRRRPGSRGTQRPPRECDQRGDHQIARSASPARAATGVGTLRSARPAPLPLRETCGGPRLPAATDRTPRPATATREAQTPSRSASAEGRHHRDHERTRETIAPGSGRSRSGRTRRAIVQSPAGPRAMTALPRSRPARPRSASAAHDPRRRQRRERAPYRKAGPSSLRISGAPSDQPPVPLPVEIAEVRED